MYIVGERERERERDLYIYEREFPMYWVLYHLHLQHLHTGNLKEHTCACNNIDHMLDISGHLQLQNYDTINKHRGNCDLVT